MKREELQITARLAQLALGEEEFDILEKGVLDSNYQLFPQDIITVPERGF